MPKRTVTLLLAMLLCTAALGAFGAPPAVSSYDGYVYDDVTRQPIAGATAYASCNSMEIPDAFHTTDANGYFVLDLLFAHQEYDFGIEATGYESYSWTAYGTDWSPGMSIYLLRDHTPPVTTQTGADDLWHSGRVVVRFTASDDFSSVDRTEYRVNGRAWTVGSSAAFFRVRHKRGGGTYTIDFRSVDGAGNVEAYRTCQVKLL